MLPPIKDILMAIFQCLLASISFYVMIGILTEFQNDFLSTILGVFPIIILLRVLNFFAGGKKL